jgi:hypothetical protein
VSLDDHTIQVARHASDVCRAIMQANRSGDRMLVAFEIVSMSMLVIDGDAERTALAWFMTRTAKKLDGDIVNATMQ